MSYVKSIFAGAALFAIAASANAQTVQASATLVSPLTIAGITDLGFGSIVLGSSEGTVTLSPSGTRTAAGGVSLASATGVRAGSVPVTGTKDNTFSVTLSGAVTLAKSDDATKKLTLQALTLKVGAFDDLYVSPVNATLDTDGKSTLLIGGQLLIPASMPAGDYNTNHSGGVPLTVTVNYN